MRLKGKLPLGVKGIANLMNMTPDEVYAWPYFSEVRESFRDYNYGVLNSGKLIERLNEISSKCEKEQIFHYSTGIAHAANVIEVMY